MKRELKRQIKQDEFVSWVGRAMAFVGAHAREARIVLVVVLLLGIGAAGFSYLQERRNREAQQAMSAALETFQAPLEAELPEGFERPRGPVFASSREKYEKAAAGFDGVARRYASLPVGRRARYFAAVSRAEMGDLEAAEKALSEIASSGGSDSLVPALARLALADVKRRAGKVDEAVDAYRQLAEDRALPLPRDHALMGLATTLEDARRSAEARAAYRRLTEEFPSSVYAAEARRRTEYLEPAERS